MPSKKYQKSNKKLRNENSSESSEDFRKNKSEKRRLLFEGKYYDVGDIVMVKSGPYFHKDAKEREKKKFKKLKIIHCYNHKFLFLHF